MQFKFLRLKPILLLFLAVISALTLKAATPAVHITAKPGWLNTLKPYTQKIAARDIDNGYFYQLNEEQIDIENQADYRHNIREIVSDAGVQNGSQITVGFDPTYERIDFHEITVWRDNKPQNRLTTASFKVTADEKELADFIYQGSYSAYCILDDIRKGDRIEYSYTITGRNPIFNNKYCRNLYFQGSQHIAHQYKSILVSPGRQLHFKSFNHPPQSTISLKNGLKCYEWENFQVKPEWDYNNQPGWYNAFEYVQVSEYNSWKEVADWARSINPVATNIGGSLAAQIAALKSSSGGDKAKYFNAAVRFVQDEVRYMGIEIGQYSHRANAPEKVFNQRYGDCKDKSLLLASILQAGGIDAEMVLVNSAIKSGIDQFIPTSNAFDHAVVVAAVNGKKVWIDATMSYQRGSGTNIYFPDYGKGLVLKAGSNGLTVIPPSKSGKVVVKETYTIPEKGVVRFDVKSTYTLNEADDLRSRLASTSMAETEKNYLNYYIKSYPKITRKDSITVLDDESKNELTTIEHYQIPDFLERDSVTGKYSASLYASYINNMLPSISNTVRVPIAIDYPYNLDFSTSVVMKSGWNIDSRHYEITKDAYLFTEDQSASGDTVLLKYHYQNLQSFIPVDKFDDYRKSIKDISDHHLSFDFDFTPGVVNLHFKPNYWMIGAVGLLIIISAIAGIILYRTETPAIVFAPGSGFTPIGGWLILIAISLTITPVYMLVKTIDTGYFDLNKWHAHPFQSVVGYRLTFVFEAMGNMFTMCYACFCFILFVNRRDILPHYIKWLYIYVLAFSLLDCVFTALLRNGDVNDKSFELVLRSILVAAIWIPYFQRSTRVEQTFIVPYPASNFSYEAEGVKEAL